MHRLHQHALKHTRVLELACIGQHVVPLRRQAAHGQLIKILIHLGEADSRWIVYQQGSGDGLPVVVGRHDGGMDGLEHGQVVAGLIHLSGQGLCRGLWGAQVAELDLCGLESDLGNRGPLAFDVRQIDHGQHEDKQQGCNPPYQEQRRRHHLGPIALR